MKFHRLTINYVDDSGETVKRAFTRDYAEGETYSVVSGSINGLQPDTPTVRGTMGTQDINITVTYSEVRDELMLTVRYVSVTDGKSVADTKTMYLKPGDKYTVITPSVAGYTPLQYDVSGTMSNMNRQITVFMIPDDASDADRDHKHIEIEDYGTPLGIPDSIMGGGEIIE